MLTSTWHYSVAMCRWFYSLTSRGNIFIRGALATTPPPLNTHTRTHAHARVTSWFPKQQAATSLPAPSLSPVFSHSIYPFISSHLPPHLLPLSPFKSPLRHKVFSSWQLLCACVRIMCCSWTAAVSLISFSSSVFLSSNCAMDATINSFNDERRDLRAMDQSDFNIIESCNENTHFICYNENDDNDKMMMKWKWISISSFCCM